MTYGKEYRIKINFDEHDDELRFRKKVVKLLEGFMPHESALDSFEEVPDAPDDSQRRRTCFFCRYAEVKYTLCKKCIQDFEETLVFTQFEPME